MVFEDIAPWAGLVAALLVFLWLDLHFFARGREPDFREAAIWSIGWLVLSLLAALVVFAFRGGEDAVLYTTVYLIERSRSTTCSSSSCSSRTSGCRWSAGHGCSSGASSPLSCCARCS
jgi:hypothetical protein